MGRKLLPVLIGVKPPSNAWGQRCGGSEREKGGEKVLSLENRRRA